MRIGILIVGFVLLGQLGTASDISTVSLQVVKLHTTRSLQLTRLTDFGQPQLSPGGDGLSIGASGSGVLVTKLISGSQWMLDWKLMGHECDCNWHNSFDNRCGIGWRGNRLLSWSGDPERPSVLRLVDPMTVQVVSDDSVSTADIFALERGRQSVISADRMLDFGSDDVLLEAYELGSGRMGRREIGNALRSPGGTRLRIGNQNNSPSRVYDISSRMFMDLPENACLLGHDQEMYWHWIDDRWLVRQGVNWIGPMTDGVPDICGKATLHLSICDLETSAASCVKLPPEYQKGSRWSVVAVGRSWDLLLAGYECNPNRPKLAWYAYCRIVCE